MTKSLLFGISRINKYLCFFNMYLKYKITCILDSMKLSEIVKKKVELYLILCGKNAYNNNLFINTSNDLQTILIQILINCFKAVDEQENDNFQELYNNILNSVENGNEGIYLKVADMLKKIHNYNKLFGCKLIKDKNEIRSQKYTIRSQIYDNDKILITFSDDAPLNINDFLV